MIGAVIAGFGPAGFGVLTGALWGGGFEELLAGGLLAVDRGPAGSAGRLGEYGIGSDSQMESFVAAIGSWQGDEFVPRGPWAQPLVHELRADLFTHRGRPVPLAWAGRVQHLLRDMVLEQAHSRGQDILRTHTQVVEARQTRQGWNVTLADGQSTQTILTRSLVLAGGAVQRPTDLAEVQVAGVRLATTFPGRIIGSDAVLRHDGPARLRDRLADLTNPRVTVIGASHSALAAANVLLDTGIPWDDSAITVMHRNRLVPMYQTPELARAEGFTEFGEADICRRTGRVFPLAGFRSASRDLLVRVRGYGGHGPEPRVTLLHLTSVPDAEVLSVLERSHLIVLATGYRREWFPLTDSAGAPLEIRGIHSPGHLADVNSQVHLVSGEVVPGLFATGLGAGFPLGGTHGEESFTGWANGTSLWQTDIGNQIAAAVVARRDGGEQ